MAQRIESGHSTTAITMTPGTISHARVDLVISESENPKTAYSFVFMFLYLYSFQPVSFRLEFYPPPPPKKKISHAS